MVICEWGGWEGGPTGRDVGGEPRGSAAEERPGDAAPVFPGCLLQAAPRRCPACRTCSRTRRRTCPVHLLACHLPCAPAGFPTCPVHLLASHLPVHLLASHLLGAPASFQHLPSAPAGFSPARCTSWLPAPARCTCWLPHLPGAPAGFCSAPAGCTGPGALRRRPGSPAAPRHTAGCARASRLHLTSGAR